jgi:hypothetical protein
MSAVHDAFFDLCQSTSIPSMSVLNDWDVTNPSTPLFFTYEEIAQTYDINTMREFFQYLRTLFHNTNGALPYQVLGEYETLDDFLVVFDRLPRLAFLYLFLAAEKRYERLPKASWKPLLSEASKYDFPEFFFVCKYFLQNQTPFRIKHLAERAFRQCGFPQFRCSKYSRRLTIILLNHPYFDDVREVFMESMQRHQSPSDMREIVEQNCKE